MTDKQSPSLEEVSTPNQPELQPTPTITTSSTGSITNLKANENSSSKPDLELQPSQNPTMEPGINNYKGGPELPEGRTDAQSQASQSLFRTFLGTGMLFLPGAYRIVGLGMGILGTIIVALIVYYCFTITIETAIDKAGNKDLTLQRFAREVLGPKGIKALQICLLSMQISGCIGLLVFMRNFINHVSCTHRLNSLCENLPFNMVISLLMIVPLSFINDPKKFNKPSIAAAIFATIAAGSLLFYSLELVSERPEIKSGFGNRLGEFRVHKFPLFFGVCTWAFQGIGILFNLRSCLKNPQNHKLIIRGQTGMISLVYLIFASFVYISLQEKTPDLSFIGLPSTNAFYFSVQILYFISAWFSFPIQLLPAIRLVENSKKLRYKLFNKKGECENKKLRYGIRLIFLIIIYAWAYNIDRVGLFTNLVGCTIFSFVGYILPLWVHSSHFWKQLSTWRKTKNIVVLVIVCVFSISGIVLSFVHMFDDRPSQKLK